MTVRRVKPWRRAGTPGAARYRLRGWRRWLMWAMFAPMLGGGLVLLALGGDGAIGGAVLTVVAGSVLGAWEWLWRRTLLELSADGLRLRQLGYTLEAPWSDVAGFHAAAMAQGFVLAQPIDTPGARRLAAAAAYAGPQDPQRSRWIGERRYIPVDAFAWHLHHGTLVAEVAARAPHLEAPMRSALADASRPLPAAERRKRVWLAALIGALVLLGVVLGWMQPPGLDRAAAYVYAAVAPLAALQVALATWQAVRSRHWLIAALLTAATLVALGWWALAWQEVMAPARPAASSSSTSTSTSTSNR